MLPEHRNPSGGAASPRSQLRTPRPSHPGSVESTHAVAIRHALLRVALVGLMVSGCSQAGSGGAEATAAPEVARGRVLHNGTCAPCHATTGDEVIVGPSLAGIVARATARVPGMDAETYLRESILDPRAYTVEGFSDNLMPTTYAQVFPPEDLEAILAYLHTLDE